MTRKTRIFTDLFDIYMNIKTLSAKIRVIRVIRVLLKFSLLKSLYNGFTGMQMSKSNCILASSSAEL